MLAVCIRCGNIKREPVGRCSVCYFQPQTPEDKACSLILSLGYEIEEEYRGKTKEELIAVAAAVQNGLPYSFDETEVQLVIAYAQLASAISVRRLTVAGIKWCLPPIVILISVYLALFWKR
jgi:hypothetical protein